jgi:hypothetical protein
MKITKTLLTVFVLSLLLFNVYTLFQSPSPQTKAKVYAASLSKGDQYFGRLSLWYIFAKAGDWDNAAKLETGLDQSDIVTFKKTHQPSELKKYINNLEIKSDKTVEDWLELARVQSILGKDQDALESLTQAKKLDPVRDDISSLYYKLSR